MISTIIAGVAVQAAVACHTPMSAAPDAPRDGTPPKAVAEAQEDPLAPLQAELSKALAAVPADDRRVGEAYLQIAIAHSRRGEGGKAKAAAAKSLKCAESVKTEAGRELEANAHAMLGKLLRTSGDLDAAEPHYRRVCELRLQLSGPKDISVAVSRDNLGVLLTAMGRLDEAEREHRAALDLIKSARGADSRDFAMTEMNLAENLRRRNPAGLEKATALLRDAVRIFESQTPSDPESLGVALDNLGGAEYDANDFKRSEATRRRALEILTKHLGTDHPETAICEHNLALSLLELDPPNRDEAMKLLQHAAQVKGERLGADHPSTQSTMQAIKSLEAEMDDGKMDEKTLLFFVRLQKLPNPAPEQYEAPDQIVRDVKAVATDPEAVARLLRACVGDTPDGHILRALGLYKTAMVPYHKALNAKFGLPDPDAGFTLGLPREVGQVKLVADPEDPASGFWLLEITMDGSSDPLVLVIGPGERGPGKSFTLGAGAIAGRSKDRVVAAGRFLTSLDPGFLSDKDALATFAESEAKSVAAGKYGTRNDAKDAFVKRLLGEHATSVTEIPPDIKRKYMKDGSDSDPR